MEVHRGDTFEAIDQGFGIEIRAQWENRSVAWLQGDDADQLRQDIETVCLEVKHPSGPFATVEQHLDALLSQYDF